ncbi:MAG: VanZ family protein [Sphingobacteriales bacterium]|nr:MAG: VanZ family protein [Sphingobacteriales bacterium]
MPIDSVSKSFLFFEGFDKIVHLGLFFVLTVLIFNGLIRQSTNYLFKFSTIITIGLVTSLYGGLIELIQWQYFTYRSGDWWDLFADTIGIAMAIFAFLLMSNKNNFFTPSNLNYENT